jgi:N-acetylglucosaminyldiphosphoundecaprenol N-acetyl-beta-D-mannosaminyltransferase
VSQDELLHSINSAIVRGSHIVVTNHNLHSVYLWHTDPSVRRFYDSADIVHIDGMPLIFAGKLMRIHTRKDQRIAYIDWLPRLLQRCVECNWSIMFVASVPGVADSACQRFREKYPTLKMKCQHGFFDPDPNSKQCKAVLDSIAEYAPDVLVIGMGMPRQELWVDQVREQLHVPVILSSAGATLDYFAGALPTPPRWSGTLGLEWLFRLVAEPRRLWRRYLLEPMVVLRILLTRKVPRFESRRL